MERVVADHEIMTRHAEGRALVAEARVATLEAELSGLRDQAERMEDLEAEVERLRAKAARADAIEVDLAQLRHRAERTAELERELEELRAAPVAYPEEGQDADLADIRARAERAAALEEELEETRRRAERVAELEEEMDRLREQSSRVAELEAELETLRNRPRPMELEDDVATTEGDLSRMGMPGSFGQERDDRGSAADAEVATLREQNEALRQQVDRLQRDLERRTGDGGGAGAADVTSRFLNEELSAILTAAEDSAKRIVERARETSEQQIAEAERMWAETQEQMQKFSAWRDRVEPIIRTAHVKIEDVRTKINDVPEAVRQALAPLADSVTYLAQDLSDVASAPNPPLLTTPTPEVDMNPDWAEAARAEAGVTSSRSSRKSTKSTGKKSTSKKSTGKKASSRKSRS